MFEPVLKRQHAVDILYMVRDVFEDFKLDMSCDLNCEDDLTWNFDLGYGSMKTVLRLMNILVPPMTQNFQVSWS